MISLDFKNRKLWRMVGGCARVQQRVLVAGTGGRWLWMSWEADYVGLALMSLIRGKEGIADGSWVSGLKSSGSDAFFTVRGKTEGGNPAAEASQVCLEPVRFEVTQQIQPGLQEQGQGWRSKLTIRSTG